MSRRLRRVVPALLLLAAGSAAAASDTIVEIHGPSSGETLQIALDELQLDTSDAATPATPRAADTRVLDLAYTPTGAHARVRAQASLAALTEIGRSLVARRAASSFSAVAYPKGNHDAKLRTVIGRRLTLGYDGAPDALAARHRCRVDSLIITGVWVLTALDDDPLAAVTAADALAHEAGVRFAEAQILHQASALHSPTDPLLDAYPVPTPYYPPWWQANAWPLDPTVPAWSLTTTPQWPPPNAWVTSPTYAVPPPGRHPAITLEGEPILFPPIGPIPPPDDAAHGYPEPRGTTPGPASPGYYWTLDPLPNQPLLLNGPDHGQWHLQVTPGGMNCKPVWSQFTGAGVTVTVVDTGMDYNHPDLGMYQPASAPGNVLDKLQLNIVTPAASVLPTDDTDNHATSVAGCVAELAGNGIGGVGTAYDAKIIPVKFLSAFNDRPGQFPSVGGARDDADYATAAGWCLKGTVGSLTQASTTTSVNTNSWGYSGFNTLGPMAASTAVLQNALQYGRFNRGVVYTFASGNDFGLTDLFAVYNTWHPFNNCAYNGFINRYTIGVGALNRSGVKTAYSEFGPNMLLTAPGGELQVPPTNWAFGPPYFSPGGIITTDRQGAKGFDIGVPNFWQSIVGSAPILPNIWDGDYTLVHPTGDAWCAANGQNELAGTSFATPNVAGVVALMLQARPELTWRDVQSVLLRRARKPYASGVNSANPSLPIGYGFTTIPGNLIDNRDASGHPIPPYYSIALVYDGWIRNRGGLDTVTPVPIPTGLDYNLWYGFGAVDATKAVYGLANALVDITLANADLSGNAQTTAFGVRCDNPGALYAPLLPVEATPLTFSFVRDTSIVDVTNPLSGFIPLGHAVGFPRLVEDLQIDRLNEVPGFVTETVELHVKTQGVARGNLTFVLESPKGTIIHVPQRGLDSANTLDFTFTFQAFRDEDPHSYKDAAGIWHDWHVFVIDTKSPDHPLGTLEQADLTVHGHLPYPTPTISSAATVGVAAGVASQINLSGSGFSTNASKEVCVTTGVWLDIPANLGTPVADVATATVRYKLAAHMSGGQLAVTIPAAAADVNFSPGDAVIEIGNPALQWGQSITPGLWYDIDDGALGYFCTDFWEAFDAAITYTAPVNGEKQRLKLAGGGSPTQIICHYSRPPTITPMPDILLPAGTPVGHPFTQQFTIDDPDISSPNLAAGRHSTDETLALSRTVFNQSAVATSGLKLYDSTMTLLPSLTNLQPGTYFITGTLAGSSGLSLVQVGVTDGVTTSYSAFRVGVLAEDSASGCGGGMGLALLGTPLAVWLIRRRRR